MSVLVTAPNVNTVSGADPGLFDIVTSIFSTDKALTGMYGLVQKAGLFLGGMSLQNYRKTQTWNPFA